MTFISWLYLEKAVLERSVTEDLMAHANIYVWFSAITVKQKHLVSNETVNYPAKISVPPEMLN